MHIQEIKNKSLRWLNIVHPTQEEIEYLRKNFNFHPLDLEDCLKPTQRPKINEYEKYHFLVLLFPFYSRKTREIQPAELHIFISPDFLITIHNNELEPLNTFFQQCQNNQAIRKKCFEISSEKLLYHLLDKLLLYIYPMLDHLSLDINKIEKEIFAGNEKKMVKEILITRRNITDFRKIMQAHKKIIQKLICGLQNSPIFLIQKSDLYFDNLIDYTKEIWDLLEGYKEAIETLQQTNESLISNRMSEIMKVLTIIFVVISPITLLTNLFSMNITNIPLSENNLGFWIIAGTNAIILITLLLIFKKKKWM